MTDANLMTVGEAAERLGCSARHVQRSIADGKLACVRLGQRVIRISETDLQEFIASHRVAVPKARGKRATGS